MAENKEYLNVPQENGSIHIAEEVVASIAVGAAKEVEGVYAVAPAGAMPDFMKKGPARGVRITVEEESLCIDLFLVVEYGVVIPEVAEKVQHAVASSVEAMTGRGVRCVNVHISGVHLN